MAGFEPWELNRLSKDTRHAGTLSVNLRREPPILKLPSHLLTRDGSISQANDRWPVIHERKRDEIAALEKTRLQALGSRGRKKERCGRGRHARGEGVLAWKALENRFNSHSVSADISR